MGFSYFFSAEFIRWPRSLGTPEGQLERPQGSPRSLYCLLAGDTISVLYPPARLSAATRVRVCDGNAMNVRWACDASSEDSAMHHQKNTEKLQLDNLLYCFMSKRYKQCSNTLTYLSKRYKQCSNVLTRQSVTNVTNVTHSRVRWRYKQRAERALHFRVRITLQTANGASVTHFRVRCLLFAEKTVVSCSPENCTE